MNALSATNRLQQFHSDFLKEMSVLAMYLRFQAFACVLEADLEHLELEGQGFVTPSPAESHCWPVTLAPLRLVATICR